MSLPPEVRWLPPEVTSVAELVGDARVVGIGENNHYLREFGLLRDSLVRFLVTELGFGVLALESGFAEGQLVDDWIAGGPEPAALATDGFTFRFGDAAEQMRTLRWVRAHNAAGGRVRFAGLDIPGSGGSPLPALHRVREYGGVQDELLDAAIDRTARYAASNNSTALARYTALDPGERDAATAALARLVLRLDAEPERTARQRIARHHALGALRLDEHLRELAALGEPHPPALVRSSRDVYQTETVRLLREPHGERVVLLMHNAHVQRVPMALLPEVRAHTVGGYLAGELGADYLAIGLTALGGSTTDGELDESERHGFRVIATPLDEPAGGSVERAIARDAADGETALLDLRPARGAAGPQRIRHVTGHVELDVLAGFDALFCLPCTSPSDFVPAGDGGRGPAR